MEFNTAILKESFDNAKVDDRWYGTFFGEADRCLRTLVPTVKETAEYYNTCIRLDYFNEFFDFNDLVQDCLEILWMRISDGKLTTSDHIDSYIVQVARYELLRLLKKESSRRAKVVLTELDNALDVPARDYDYSENELSAIAEKTKDFVPEGRKEEEMIFQIDKKSLAKVAEFSSICSAAKETGIPKGNISAVLSGKRKTAGGYIWMSTGNPLSEVYDD